jgi:hypothetical protein
MMLFGTVLWRRHLPGEQIKLPRYRPRPGWVSSAEILAWIAFGSAMPMRLWDRMLFQGASLWPLSDVFNLRHVLFCISEGQPLPVSHSDGVLRILRRRLADADRVRSAPLDQVQSDPVRTAAREWSSELHAQLPRAQQMLAELDRASSILRRTAARGEISIFCQPKLRAKIDPTTAWLYGTSEALVRIPPAKFDAPLIFGEDQLWQVGEHRHVTEVARGIVLDGAQAFELWPDPDSNKTWSGGVEEDEPGPPENAAQPVPEKAALRGLGGRPAKHDWNAFWQEATIYAASNGLELENRPELQKHMEEWTAARWLDSPDAATIRKKLAELYAKAAGRI